MEENSYMKTTWRFLYVDVNRSLTVNETESEWISYISIRAPKGNLKADLVMPDNEDQIKFMFGYPSADYPDVYDAIELNKYYATYICANPATSANVPNYYGGRYLTSLGNLKMFNNTSKDKPNFLVSVRPFEANSILHVSNPTITTALNAEGAQAVITVDDIPAMIIKQTSEISLDYWKTGVPFRYSLDKKTGLIFPVTGNEEIDKTVACGSFIVKANGNYTLVLGGTKSNCLVASDNYKWNTLNHEKTAGVPFLDYTQWNTEDVMFDYSKWTGTETELASDKEKVLNAIMGGDDLLQTVADDVQKIYDLDYEDPLPKRFRFLFNCEPYVNGWVVQKSPTSLPTDITMGYVQYDKYLADHRATYISVGSQDAKTILDKLPASYQSEVIVVLGALKSTLWAYVEDEDTETSEWTDVTSDYETETFLLEKAINKVILTEAVEAVPGTAAVGVEGEEGYVPAVAAVAAVDEVSYDATAANKEVAHNIYYAGATQLKLCELPVDANNPEDSDLIENPYYNCFSVKATEVDEDGVTHTVGPMQGSLDESALTENGSLLYWEDIFSNDAVSFIEVHPYRTFDDLLDEKGYYTGTRIPGTSSFLSREDDGTTETYTVTGQRYMDFIVQKNIKNGNTGCNITDAKKPVIKEFERAAKEAITEAMNTKYEDALLFVDTVGTAGVHKLSTKLRAAHTMATFISPKSITDQEFENLGKVTVDGRCRGFAQYCQELQFRFKGYINGKNVSKKYFACPIGAMAAMMMRINVVYMGGKQPSWINDGSVGGQIDEFFIGRTPIKARWDFDSPQTKILDDKGINPIVFDTTDGVMAVSGNTTELNAGDWRELGHSMAFDLCKREITADVMKPQLEKAINNHYMSIRKRDTDKILNRRVGTIWTSAKCEIFGVNDEISKAQGIFNIQVSVLPDAFSKWVKLEFINEGQTTTVKE